MAKITLEDLQSGSGQAIENQEPTPEVKEEPKTEEQPEPTPKAEEPVAKEPEVKEPEKAPEPKEEEKEPLFDFTEFNRSLNKNYESFEQIQADLDKPTMETEYQEAKEQLEKLQTERDDLQKLNDLLVEQTDPYTYFTGESAMKAEMFKKQYPKKDAGIVEKVFTTEDLSNIDDLEMVKMGWKFNASKSLGTDAKIEAAIKEELRVDPEDSLGDLSDTAQVRLAKMANDYREAFDSMKKDVKLPDRVNLEELRQKQQQEQEQTLAALNEGWSEVAEKSLKETSKIKVPIGDPKEGEEQQFFEWDLNDVKDDVEQLKQNYISLGLDPNQEMFQESLEIALFKKNMSQIMEKYGNDLLARQKKDHLEETHNPEPIKDGQRSDLTAEEKEKQDQTAYALGGIGPGLHTHPLFTIKK